MCAHISASLRQLADSRAEKVGLTRFFRNDRVTVAAEISATCAARTAQAAAGRDVLVIQDTSEVNYPSKAGRKRGLGRVGNGKDAGLFVHPALVVDTADGSVLGLAGATIWRRDKVKAANYQSLPIEKESNRWLVTPSGGARRWLRPRRSPWWPTANPTSMNCSPACPTRARMC